jgi:pyridoxamine 5'-phosphate oxidase
MSLWSPPPDDAPRRLADLRVSYDTGALVESDLASSPLEQFRSWFEAAAQAGMPEPNAMVASTAASGAQPSSRTVLLKDVDERGFSFYTNLGSRKSSELGANPGVSLVFPWFAMHRQVVVVGRAELIGRAEVEAYFASRPRGSQLGAGRAAVDRHRRPLDARGQYARLATQYPEGTPIPAPDFWGGWLVRPITVEFWQGRVSRLHDRLRFRAVADSSPSLAIPEDWVVERLSP